METVNINLKKEDDPLYIEVPDTGPIVIERRLDTAMQWTCSPENNAWHSMNEKEIYVFGFPVYIRVIDGKVSRMTITRA